MPTPPPAVVMTPKQIYAVMKEAGFPPAVATTMTAIALRESGGVPSAFNGNEATGDRSFGLLQINMKSPEVAALITKTLRITDEKQLLDPLLNARAGFVLYGGKRANLNVAWYIDRPGVYKDRYEKHLAAAQAAALESV